MMLKRLLTLIFHAICWLIVAAVLLCILADIVCEVHGLPDMCANIVRARFADQGLHLRAETIRAGLFNGLVIDHAQLRTTYADMPVLAQCRQFTARPRLTDLWYGRRRFPSVTFEGLTIHLYPSGNANEMGASSLSLQRCDGSAQSRPDQSLAIHLDGLLESIHVTLSADVRNIDRLDAPTPDRHEPTTVDPPVADQQVGLAEQLQRLSRFLDSCQLTERDAFVSGNATVDMAAVQQAEFVGQFGVSDVLIEDVMLRKAKGTIHYRDRTANLSNLAVFMSRDETITGSLVCDLDAGRVSGTLRGGIRPRTVWLFAHRTMPQWLSQLTFGAPVSVIAELLPSPFDPVQWRIRADVDATQVAYRDLAFSRISAGLWWDGRTIAMNGLAGTVGTAPADEYLAGDVCWDTQEQILAGDAMALLRPLERLRQLGIMLPRPLRDAVDVPELVSLNLRLSPSPLDWTRWQAQGDVSCPVLSGWRRDIGPLTGRLDLAAGIVSLTDMTIGLVDAPADVLRVGARMDLADAVERRVVEADVTIQGRAPETAANADTPAPAEAVWNDALALQGTVRVEDGTLTGAAAGTAYPGRFYSPIQERLRIPDEGVVNRIHCKGPPAQIRVNIVTGKGVRGFRLEGSADAENVLYGDLTLSQAHTGIELDLEGIRLVEAHGTTEAGDRLAVDLDIQFWPPRVAIRNGRVEGNPLVATTFIDHQDSRRIYEAVWKDFVWDSASPPLITVQSLVYQDGGDGASWNLKVNADIKSRDARYRDLRTRSLDATVLLDLPGSVTVRDARVETSTGGAKGRVDILTGDIPKCSFEIGQFEGGTDPRQILHVINPEWDEWLQEFQFSDKSAVSCQGSFYLSREPRLQIYGTIQAPFCEFSRLRFVDPAIAWQVKESRLHWNLQNGTLFDGKAALTGTYDTETGQGLIAFRGDNMRFYKVAQYVGAKADETTHKGLLSGHCRLQLLRGWAGRERQLSGNGRLSLIGGDVWQVPLFSSLGKLLDVTFISRLTGGRASALGSITRVDADLSFNGDRAIIRNLRTDGTLISLAGKGEYDWEADRLYLGINGRALEKMSLLSLVFKPLSWVFNAELTGSAKQAKWRLSTPLQKSGGAGADGSSGLIPID